MLALLLLAAPPLTAAATVASHPSNGGDAHAQAFVSIQRRTPDQHVAWAAPGPGMERAPVRLFVSGPVTAQGRYRGHTAEEWAARFRRRTRQYQNARRVMLRSPHVVEAINLACVVYGNCQTLWRKAGCETGGTYSARSLNSSSGASGIFQFIPSTWRTTPFRAFSVWSPYASALAAGWMHKAGRGSEWECR